MYTVTPIHTHTHTSEIIMHTNKIDKTITLISTGANRKTQDSQKNTTHPPTHMCTPDLGPVHNWFGFKYLSVLD